MDPVLQYLSLFVTGILAGTASGTFGIGGGCLMTPVQFWVYTAGGLDSTLATRVAFGTSLAVMLPTLLSGTLGHHKRGAVDWKAAVPMGIAAVAGGFFGGTIAAHMPGFALRVFFALIVIVTAVQMLRHKPTVLACERKGSLAVFIVLGFCIGTVSGLSGLGGGALLVPVLVILLCYPIHQAVGTSSACLIFSSAGALTAYIVHGRGVTGLPAFTLGYVDFVTFAILAVTTIPFARLGVRFAHACSDRSLHLLFACLQVVIGVSMIVTV